MENSSLKLSIVVPIYNVADYLAKCLDSLLTQDIASDAYEVVLVNDGSTDGGELLAQRYAQEYAHVHYLSQANGGLSAARNTGLAAARGEYVLFVDSDDFLQPNVLGALLQQADRDRLDVLRFAFQNVNERYEVFSPYKERNPHIDYSESVVSGAEFLRKRLGYGCYAWQFLIRRSLATKVPFRQGILFEDTEWAPRLLERAERVASTDLVVCNYLVRKGSITQADSDAKRRQVLRNQQILVESLLEQMRPHTDQTWYRGMIAHTTVTMLTETAISFYNERKTLLKFLKEKQLLPLSAYQTTSRIWRKILIVNISPRFYLWLIHLKQTILKRK